MPSVKIFTPVLSEDSLANSRSARSIETSSHSGLIHDLVDGESEIDAFSKFLDGDIEEKMIHVLSPNCIVLPSFYDAAETILQHTKCDYAFCHFLNVQSDEESGVFDYPVKRGTFHVSQFLVRPWVFKEMGIGRSLEDMYERIICEYRGAEIKSVLCVGI